MIKSSKTAQEFIQSSFSPIIAVLSSPNVDNVVSKNNLSFSELLQPFTNMEGEGQFREPGGSVCLVKNWKLVVRNVNWKPLQPTEARRQLNNAVLNNYNEKTISIDVGMKKFDIPHATPWFDAWRETYLEVQFPSDHEFTKHFISCIIVGAAHEENIIDTFNNLNQQYAQLQNVTPPKLPKWFNNGVLKSYLLVHDVSTLPKDKADAAFELLKHNFGANNCFMLTINSKSSTDPPLPPDLWAQYIKRTETNNETASSMSNLATTPVNPQVPPITDDTLVITSTNSDVSHPLTNIESDVYDNANSLQTHAFSGSSESMNIVSKGSELTSEIHGGALNASDVDAIKKFLQEYAAKALLPFLEKQISQLSELVANRKGVSRSLFSATKRWFGTGKGGNTTVSNTVIYSSDCPELQLRRLGDLWFLTGQWQRAFDAYHTAKREFYADSAWLCYAGALEMAAISAFMAGDANRKTHGYMEESIVTYLNTCRMVQYAVRASLLSVLCLNSAGLHGEAAKQLIRMTSEDSDLRSAMLLEQASLCFLSGPGSKAMCRKYAFHIVLAGHRFSKAGQKKHAYRCYQQAYQVYGDSGWRLAGDHVQFAAGRLASALKRPRDALHWLTGPLAPASRQPPAQQHAFLLQFVLAQQQWIESSDEYKDKLPELPLPLVENDATSLLSIGPAPLSSPGWVPASSITLQDASTPEHDKYWHKMEEMLVQVAQGSLPMIFKPTVDLYTEKTDSYPNVPQGEPIQISITLRNPLKIPLLLKDVELLWRFIPSAEESIETPEILNNEPSVAAGTSIDTNVICGQKIKAVTLDGDSNKVLTFALTPLHVGQLNILGVAYKLIYVGESGVENGNSKSISGKLNLTPTRNNDKRLQITVTPHAPCLQMSFSEINTSVMSGEIKTVDVKLRNVGPVDMGAVFVCVSHPDAMCLVTNERGDKDFALLYDDKYCEPVVYPDERAARAAARRAQALRHVCRPAPGLPRGHSERGTLLLRPRTLPALYLLAYYSDGGKRYRLLRHVFKFAATEVVEIAINPRRSLKTVDGNIMENMNLAVEVKNLCGERDGEVNIEILEASLLSRQWRLTGLTTTRDHSSLTPHERLHLVFKAQRILEMPVETKVQYSQIKVAKGHPDSVANVNLQPYSKFVTENKPSCLEEADISQPKRTGLIQSMFVLRWKAQDKSKGRSAVGQHCLWLDCFTKAQSSAKDLLTTETPSLQLEDYDSTTEVRDANSKAKKDSVVVFNLVHENHVSHNFKERKLCLVPVAINIVNCYGVPVNVFIDMSKQSNRESSEDLGWAGALSTDNDVEVKNLGVSVDLKKFESRRVELHAICAVPGTYLVGSGFAVTATTGDRCLASSQISNNSSLLVVQQSA